jgi:hypothetical protein
MNGKGSTRSQVDISTVREVTLRLLEYCRTNDWSGYDPYDALNSPLFRTIPILDSRLPRLVLTQLLKRSPINIRRLFDIPKTQNPKALGLFLTALLKLLKLDLLEDRREVTDMIDRILRARSTGTKYWCWGYSFPWQTRTIVVPRGSPNLVCTTFVASSLLNAFDELGEERFLEIGVSVGEYFINELYYTEGQDIASFSYPLPGLKTKIHNANFLAAAFLCRLFHYTKDDRFLEPALKVSRYSAGKQRTDGSWAYGELPGQEWVDNFHTGYNLSGLHDVCDYLPTSEFESNIRRGFAFYRKHFFREDGAVRYFHDRTYPIDIHCVAQSLLTLLEFEYLDLTNVTLVSSVYAWVMRHMWNEAGFFYYRVLRSVAIRTSYMRWSQAWMLLALSTMTARGQGHQAQALSARTFVPA